eukprot:tig00000691_g3161.t1
MESELAQDALRVLRACDFFPKVQDEFKSKTSHGGGITLVCAFFIVVLMLGETYQYAKPTIKHQMFVDTTHSERIRINVNITFPKLPCGFLSLDTLDASGEHQLNVVKNFEKQRIDKNGRFLVGPEKDINQLVRDMPRSNALAALSQRLRISLDGTFEDNIPEKKDDDPAKRERAAKEVDEYMSEGCIMSGFLLAQKVAGNFHFSLHGTSHHVISSLYTDKYTVDIRHRINELSFGLPVPGSHNPLDGVENANEDGSGTFQYYLKVVPTVLDNNGLPYISNQYSVTEHFKSIREEHAGHKHYSAELPAVYFIYEFSPIMVRVTEGRGAFGPFLTRLCALVGGVFTVAGLINNGVHQLAQALNARKGIIGKPM